MMNVVKFSRLTLTQRLIVHIRNTQKYSTSIW